MAHLTPLLEIALAVAMAGALVARIAAKRPTPVRIRIDDRARRP